jgi:hypothetical protein
MAIESYTWGKASKNGRGKKKSPTKKFGSSIGASKTAGPTVKKPKKIKTGY